MTLNLKRPQKTAKFNRTVLIDADLLCYAISDPIHYEVVNGLIQMFVYKKDAVRYCKDNKIDAKHIDKCYDEPEPLANVLHTVKIMIQGIIKGCQANPRLILSSPTNFRYSIAPDYKIDRKDTKKPFHYQNIKDYLIKTWNAETSPEGLETDDWAAMLATENPEFIMASNDKDFLTVKGLHYKWSGHHAGNVFTVTDDDAEAFLCTQLLTGDGCDSIISPLKFRLKNGDLGTTGYGETKNKPRARDFLMQYEYNDMRHAVHELYRSQGFMKEYDINYALLAIGRTEV